MITKDTIINIFSDAKLVPTRDSYIQPGYAEGDEGIVFVCGIGSLEHALGRTRHGEASYYGLALANGESMVEAAIGLEDGFMGWGAGSMTPDASYLILSPRHTNDGEEFDAIEAINLNAMNSLNDDPLSRNQYETYRRCYMAGAEAWHELHCVQQSDKVDSQSTACRLCIGPDFLEREFAELEDRVDDTLPDPVWLSLEALAKYGKHDDLLKPLLTEVKVVLDLMEAAPA